MTPPPEQAPADPAWATYSCARCGEAFVLQSGGEEALSAASCPHCGAPAKLTTDRREPGEFAKLTTPRGRQRRERRKRKVHTEHDLDWESPEDLAARKEGEVTEYLTSSPEHPRGIRLKRVRRKKKPGRWQKLSLKLRLWTIAGITVVSAGLLYLAMHNLFVVAATDSDAAGHAKVDLGPDVRTLDDEGVPTVVTPTELNACRENANKFFAADSVEEKLQHVRDPERVRPLMQRWYAVRGHAGEKIEEILMEKKYTIGEMRFISLAVELAGGSKRFLSFEQTADTFRLDWEVSVGYQQMPLEEFRDSRPTTPTPFRVKVKLGDDYSVAPFDDALRYQCVQLSYPGDRAFQLTAYIERDAAWAAVFLAKLEFGTPSVILNLRYPQAAASNSHVEVVELVHDSWYYLSGQPAAAERAGQ